MNTPTIEIVKERPLLFSGEMVRAILSGNKSQTRRIVKAKLPEPCLGVWASESEPQLGEFVMVGDGEEMIIRCPLGKVGDRIWVRETWALVRGWDDDSGIEVWDEAIPKTHPDPTFNMHGDPDSEGLWGPTYRADDDWPEEREERGFDWRPSIFMPRWASRLILEITDIRVERLNEISEEDAIAEGCREPSLVPIVGACFTERQVYAKLWEHINGKGAWQRNDWVWAISFRRIELTNDSQ